MKRIQRVGRIAVTCGKALDQVGHFRKGVLINMAAGQTGALRLDQKAKFHQIAEQITIQLGGAVGHNGGQRLRCGLLAVVAHHRAAAGHDLQKALAG